PAGEVVAGQRPPDRAPLAVAGWFGHDQPGGAQGVAELILSPPERDPKFLGESGGGLVCALRVQVDAPTLAGAGGAADPGAPTFRRAAGAQPPPVQREAAGGCRRAARGAVGEVCRAAAQARADQGEQCRGRVFGGGRVVRIGGVFETWVGRRGGQGAVPGGARWKQGQQLLHVLIAEGAAELIGGGVGGGGALPRRGPPAR